MALRIPLLALTRKNLKPEVAYGWASNDACPIHRMSKASATAGFTEFLSPTPAPAWFPPPDSDP